MARFAREIDFETHLMKRPRRVGGILDYYAGLLSLYRSADVFLAAYPYFCIPTPENPLRTVDRYILRALHRMRSKRGTILYVVDLPIEQRAAAGTHRKADRETYRTVRDVFESFDVLCVVNESMKQMITAKYRVGVDKFVQCEMGDHATSYIPSRDAQKPSGKWTIAYAGDFSEGHVGKWARELLQSESIKYVFRGRNWNWISELHRPDIFAEEFLSDVPLLEYLSAHVHFGIIYPPSEAWLQYYNSTSTSKLGTYLAAGLPILVSSKCQYISSLVSKYGVGLAFDGLENIPSTLEQISQSDYEEMRIHSLDLGEKVRSGYFFKRTMGLAMDKLGVE